MFKIIVFFPSYEMLYFSGVCAAVFEYKGCFLISLGVCAAIVDIGATWMSDLKEGVCSEAFWLNREHCCWAANDTTFDQDGCSQVGLLLH